MTPETLFLFAPAGQGGGGMMIFFVQLMLIVGIFYFLIIRPKIQQEKKHRERLATIKRGDRIVTAGGIIADVVHIKDNQLTVKSGDARLLVQRDRVADVITPVSSGESK